MQLLEHAIKEAGGVSALARALKLPQSTVASWRQRGSVPAGWQAALPLLYPQKKKKKD
jgi:DNA-binding transcriptional regulator YiaG